MSTPLAAMKASADLLMVAMELIATARRIDAVLKRVHERGTPWNEEDQAEVDAQEKQADDRLAAVRKAAGFV